MYTEYFGFREKPFNVTPDSRFFYANSGYQEAYANLLYGIRERKGFVVLTGEVGTGKTTLLRRLMVNLEANVRFVFFYNTTLTFEELLRFTCEELGLTVKEQSRLEQIQALNTFLLGQLANGGTAALLIDEAQNLQDDVLENLRLLSNLEATGEKLLQIVLVGQPELEAKLDQPALRQLKQRITLHCYLDRLKDQEVGDFISYRLRTAGYEGKDLFTPEAIQRVAAYSRGIPRVINIIGDNALLIAYATAQKTISAATINEVARDLRLTTALQPIAPPIPQTQGEMTHLSAVWEETKMGEPRLSPLKRRRVVWIGTLMTILFLIGGGAVVLSPLSGKDIPADLGFTVKGLLDSVEKRLGIPEQGTSPAPPSTEVNEKQDQESELYAGKSAVQPQKNSAPPSPIEGLDPQKDTRPLDFSPEVELKKEAVLTGEDSTRPSDTLPTSFSADTKKERLFVIRYGSTILRIAADVYGSNLFLGIDLLKEFNPHLENFNWVLAGQKLWLPPLTAETLLREEDGSYRFIVSSFWTQQKAQRLARTVRAKGYEVSVTPRRISDSASLYRVEIENLKTLATANKAWEEASASRWLVLEEKEEPKKRPGR